MHRCDSNLISFPSYWAIWKEKSPTLSVSAAHIHNPDSKFLASGDSGSLMVEDVNSNPRAVGLLFAGSSTLAVANPIDDVLSFFGATMVGN
jgi:hypothetical protein